MMRKRDVIEIKIEIKIEKRRPEPFELDVEDAIGTKIMNQLEDFENLKGMGAAYLQGKVYVKLVFDVGTDIKKKLYETKTKISRINSFPFLEEAEILSIRTYIKQEEEDEFESVAW